MRDEGPGSILGVDPGVSETGWAVLDSVSSRPLASGVIRTSPRQPLTDRLSDIHSGLSRVIRAHSPSSVAVEEMFFVKRASTIRGTLEARGVILLAASQAGCSVSEYNPRTVKLSLTGSGSADKAQMQRMIVRLFKLPAPPRPDDVADAMAVALCHLRMSRFRRTALRP